MINPIFDLVSPILDKVLSFIPNPVEREKVKVEQTAALLAALQANDNAQLEVDKAEAANPNLFVSGWRPFCGWVAGVGMAWTFVLKPIADWAIAIYHPGLITPSLDSQQLMTLLFGMLGMGALRSFDKYNGTETK